MFGSLARLVKDVADVTVKPALAVAEVVTAPVAAAANEATKMTTDFAKDARRAFK